MEGRDRALDFLRPLRGAGDVTSPGGLLDSPPRLCQVSSKFQEPGGGWTQEEEEKRRDRAQGSHDGRYLFPETKVGKETRGSLGYGKSKQGGDCSGVGVEPDSHLAPPPSVNTLAHSFMLP